MPKVYAISVADGQKIEKASQLYELAGF